MNKYYLILLIVPAFSQACKEKYTAKLDEATKTLVVDARLSNDSGPQTINLSYAMSFNAGYPNPLQKADVVVSDKNNVLYKFTEVFPGVYTIDHFIPDSGNIFTLHVHTLEGKSYVSAPQAFQLTSKIDVIYGEKIEKTMEVDAYGMTNFVNETGIEFLTKKDLSNDPSPYYRYSNNMLITYTTDNDPYSGPYCWLTYSPSEFLNLFSQENTTAGAEHILGFIPADPAYYGIENQVISYPAGSYFQGSYTVVKSVHSIRISFKQFHINKDVFEYYQAMNTQLAARQRIFEPASYQFRGNIKSMDNPGEVVLGVFEVASFQIRTLLLDPYLYNMVFYEERPFDIDKISKNNCTQYAPSFWQ
jgi:hypothetical protein